MNLLRLRLDRFCNAIRAWHLKRVEPERREEFNASLTEPLPDRYKDIAPRNPTPRELEDEGAGFMALYAQVKGG